jgi:hypothetical protein
MFRAASEVSRYSVEEPQTPVEHGGFQIPRGGDEELMEMIESWNGRRDETVALEYNNRGDDLLESFLERHVADLPDGGQSMKRYLHVLEDFGAKYAQDRLPGAPADMRRVLMTQIVPVVKTVMRANAQKQQARGARDFVSGRASDARDQRDQIATQTVAAAVLANISGMEEFRFVQDMQDRSRLQNLSSTEELQMNQANLTLLERQHDIWNQANQEHKGAFNSTLTRLERQMKTTQTKINFTTQEIHGMGSKARRRRGSGINRSFGRPSMLMVADKNRQALLDQGSINALGPPKRGEYQPHPSPSQPDEQKVPENRMVLRGGVRSESKESQGDADAALEAFESDIEAGEVKVVRSLHGDYITGYRLPFKAASYVYEHAYGVKARDVVDLFTTYHRYMDYKSTAESLISIMSRADESVGLDKTLPDSMMQKQGNRSWAGRTLGEILRSRATGQKAGSGGANLDFATGNFTQTQAFNLIKQGNPNKKPRRGLAADPKARADAVRPNGLLVELYNAWRLSAAAQEADLRNTDALQIFSYHRGQLAPRNRSVSREPSAFREGVDKMNLSRTKLKLIGSLFGTHAGESPFDPTFWAKPIQEQIAFMKSYQKRTGAYNPNRWIEVLENAYDMDVGKELGIKKGTAGSYNDAARERIWTAVSAKMKAFMQEANISTAQVGDYLARYAAGQSPSASPPPDDPRRKRKRRAPRRDLSREQESDEEEAGHEPGRRRKRLTEQDAKKLDILGLRPFPKPGSYAPAGPGSHLYKAWGDQLDILQGDIGKDNIETASNKYENQLFVELKKMYNRRRGGPSSFHLYTNLRGNRKNADYDSFKVSLDKFAWNEYIRGLGDWADKKRAGYLFDVKGSKFVFEQVFRPGDHDVVSDLLQKWMGARIWNLNTADGRGSDDSSRLSLNVFENWNQEISHLFERYKVLHASYQSAGEQFPVPDWKERLDQGNQIKQLSEIYDSIGQRLEAYHEPYQKRRPQLDGPEEEKQHSLDPTPARKRSKPSIVAPTPVRIKPFQLKPFPKMPNQPGGGGQVGFSVIKPFQPKPFQPMQPMPHQPGGGQVGGGLGEPDDDFSDYYGSEGRGEVLGELYDEHEEEIEAYQAQVRLPIRPHNNKLRAEVVQQNNYGALNGVHLLQTDNDVQPVMGAVHIVQPAEHFSDKHFMFDVEGDINEGQKVLVERSKRGPFRAQIGRSTVMDRSAHVTYRKRAGAFEITVRRGVIASEMQQLLSKLGMHRMSVHGSRIVIIKGNKRFRLGPLGEINFQYLSELIDECIQQYGSCGLEITETQSGRGALYKGHAHGARFKSKARKRRK